MAFILKIKNSIKSLFKLEKQQSEEEYYKYLFIESDNYSSANPNTEEKKRWDHIKLLIQETNLIGGQESDNLIIDFGCGRGWLTNLLSDYGKSIGIEPVETVVEHGRKLYPNIEFHCGSLELLGSYKADLIVSSEVIEHIPNNLKIDFFQKIYNSLNENGYFIITTPRQEVLKEWSKYSNPSQPIEDWISESEMVSLAERINFKVLKKLTYSEKPIENSPEIEVYQQWLFQKIQ